MLNGPCSRGNIIISLTDIQGCVPLMTIMSFIRGLSRKFLWGGGGGGGEF